MLSIFTEVQRCDAGEHLGQVSYDLDGVFGVPDDLEQVLVAHEIKARESGSLFLQVIAQRLLDAWAGSTRQMGE